MFVRSRAYISLYQEAVVEETHVIIVIYPFHSFDNKKERILYFTRVIWITVQLSAHLLKP